MGGNIFTAKWQPNSVQPDVIPACSLTIPRTDKLYCVQNRSTSNVYASARSRHPGGVNVAMADGGVRFVRDSIDLLVWQSLATRMGGEALNDF